MSYVRLNPTAGNQIKQVDKTVTTNNYGNVDLDMYMGSVMVIAVKQENAYQHNMLPFLNASKWYAYAVKNQAGTSLALAASGTTMTVRIWYIEL